MTRPFLFAAFLAVLLAPPSLVTAAAGAERGAADLWEQDSFDGLSPGPLDQQNGWFRTSPETASAEVLAGGGAGQSLLLEPASGATIAMRKHVIEQSTGRHRLDLRVKVNGTAEPSIGKLEVRTRETGEWDKKFQLYFGSSMRISHGPAGQARVLVPEGTMAYGRWYQLRILIHLAREQVDVWVDGVRVVNDLDVSPGPITGLGIAAWDRQGSVELDDLRGAGPIDEVGTGCSPSGSSIELVSVNNAGTQANGASVHPSISADGRFVAFSSNATNLSALDDDPKADIYVYDRESCTVRIVSLGDDGPSNAPSQWPSISADGQRVAFESRASNFFLDAEEKKVDTNGVTDVYVAAPGGLVGVTVRRSGFVARLGSLDPALSEDGGWVSFESLSSDLVTNDLNAERDVFLAGVGSTSFTRISQSAAGLGGDRLSSNPAISADGRLVAFSSLADNLVAGVETRGKHVFVYDRVQNALEIVSRTSDETVLWSDNAVPAISSDGNYVTFVSNGRLDTDDTNGYWDRYLRDRELGETEVMTNGGVVAWRGDVSAHGRFAITAESGIHVYDRRLGTKTRADLGSNDQPPVYQAKDPSMSADGRYVAFEYLRDDLMPEDTNETFDVFVRDIGPPLPVVNSTPVADAGPDLVVETFGARAAVSFDGSLSFDPDGDPLEFVWSGDFGAVEGAGPTVEMTIGVHVVELEVRDPLDATDADSLVVEVVTDPDLLFADGFESGDLTAW